MSILTVSNLRKAYGGIDAIADVSFEITDPGITGVIGPNGAGKTTLFNLISGFENPDSGHVYMTQEDITTLAPNERAEMGLVRTFQHPALFSGLTVYENLLVAGENPSNESAWHAFYKNSKPIDNSELVNRIFELLQTIGLEDKANTYANELSGGQRKLLELGKVLMLDPDIILLDEPTAGVHPQLVDTIRDIILDISKNKDILFLVVEHDVPFIREISDDILVLADGRRIGRGKYESLRNSKEVVEAYLG